MNSQNNKKYKFIKSKKKNSFDLNQFLSKNLGKKNFNINFEQTIIQKLLLCTL